MKIRSLLRRPALAISACLAAGLAACGGDGGGGAAAAEGQSAAADRTAATAPAVPTGAAAEVAAPSGAGAEVAVPSGPGVEVIAKDIAFEPAEIRVGSGPTAITLRNVGVIVHTLLIEEVPAFGKLEADQGASATGVLNLPPGTYTAFCDQAGHRAAGMVAKLTVG
jgi:plastocyanin